MPNIKSAIKRVKVNKTKSLGNQMVKNALKTNIHKFEGAVTAGDKATAEKTFFDASVKVDKAVTKGILHKNTAARKKSSMAKILADMK